MDHPVDARCGRQFPVILRVTNKGRAKHYFVEKR